MREALTSSGSPPGLNRCPSCGALNPEGAAWCGQCLERIHKSSSASVPPDQELVSGPAAGDSPDGPSAGAAEPGTRHGSFTATSEPSSRHGSFTATSEGVMWSCSKCHNENSIDAGSCTVCGTRLADALSAEEQPRPRKEPNAVALVSLAWPGAGHAYLGLWGQGVGRGVIALWLAAVVLVTGIQGGAVSLVPLTFGVIAFAFWIVAAHDAYREATGASSMVVLKQRYFLYVVLALLMLLLALVVVQGLGAGGGVQPTSGEGRFGG